MRQLIPQSARSVTPSSQAALCGAIDVQTTVGDALATGYGYYGIMSVWSGRSADGGKNIGLCKAVTVAADPRAILRKSSLDIPADIACQR
jgi:hypothetical protein